MIVRALRASELDECLDLWRSVFGEASPGFFEKYFYGDSEFQPEYTRVVEDCGRLISAVHIVRRRIWCGDFELNMAGIANVATLPEWRGKGVNTQALAQAMEIIECDAFDVAMLGTGIPEYYRRSGWSILPMQWAIGCQATVTNTSTKPSGHTIRPYIKDDDAAIYEIYNEYTRFRPIAVQRSASYFRRWVQWADGACPYTARVACHAGKPVGYILYQDDHEVNATAVHEIACKLHHSGCILSLIDAATAARFRDWGVQFRVLWTQEVKSAVEALFAKVTTECDASRMVRATSLSGLLRGIMPILLERWITSGAPAGSLAWASPYGTFGLLAAGRSLTVTEEPQNGNLLDQTAWFSGLFGLPVDKSRIDEEGRALHGALVPENDVWFGQLDSF